ncbi:MAG: hypothetical protein ACOCV8_03060, partial [Spirochaetota bacterium]
MPKRKCYKLFQPTVKGVILESFENSLKFVDTDNIREWNIQNSKFVSDVVYTGFIYLYAKCSNTIFTDCELISSDTIISDTVDNTYFLLWSGNRNTTNKGFLNTTIENDFNADISDIDDLNDLINTNESDISDHEGRISTNESNLVNHEGRISTNESDISDHEGRISTNETDLSTNNSANALLRLNESAKIPDAQIPSLAIVDTYSVSSESEQLNLTVEQGDVCIRTDESKTYINKTGGNTDMTDWAEVLNPSGAVTSVNGETGTVNLNLDDIDDGSTYGKIKNSQPAPEIINTSGELSLNFGHNMYGIGGRGREIPTDVNFNSVINGG